MSNTQRVTAIVLALTTVAILAVGNNRYPEVAGRDFTPFEVSGVIFVVGVLPVCAVLAYLRRWKGVAAIIVVHQAFLVGLIGAWIGMRPALAFGALSLLAPASRALIGRRFSKEQHTA